MKILLLLIVSILISSCNNAANKSNDTLVVGISAIPATLDPRFALDSEGMKLGSLIFQSLVKIGPKMNVVGDLANDWKLITNNDSVKEKFILQFNLKPELKFSSGELITCEDILFSIKQYQNENSPFKSAFKNIINMSCKLSDLKLFFSEYSEKVLNSDLPVIKIMPKSIVTKFQDNFKEHLVGSGPFKVFKIKETEIMLASNEHYPTPPKISFLKFKIIKDDFTRFLKMYRGDLDLAISSLPKNKIFSLQKLDHLEIIRKPGLSMTYLLLNLKNKELNKLSNRKLIFNGINRKEIIKYKLEGLAEPATSILTPTNPYFYPAFLNYVKPETQPEKLRQEVLKTELSKIILNLKTSNTREAVENAKLIASQLRKLGLRINHQSYEWGTYYKDVKQGDFDMATMSWVGAYDPDIYRIAFASKELPPEGRNRGYYKNPRFDKIVEKGAIELNPEIRKELYYQAQKIIFDDLAIIPLWYEETITVLDKRVKNYQASLNGDYSGLIAAYFQEP